MLYRKQMLRSMVRIMAGSGKSFTRESAEGRKGRREEAENRGRRGRQELRLWPIRLHEPATAAPKTRSRQRNLRGSQSRWIRVKPGQRSKSESKVRIDLTFMRCIVAM